MKLLMCIALCFYTSFAAAGNSVGNAGDIAAMEFTWAAVLAVKRLRDAVVTAEQRTQINAIEAKLKVVRVTSLPRLVLNGHDVDAINYPDEDLIEINQERWETLKKSTAGSRIGFALHEFLGVARFDDAGYRLSKALTDRIRDERFADVALEEALLNSIASLRWNIHMAKLRPTGRDRKKDDTRSYCFLAGRIRGQSQMLGLFFTNAASSLSGPRSEKALEHIADGSRQIEIYCDSGKVYADDLKASVARAEVALADLTNLISANIELPAEK